MNEREMVDVSGLESVFHQDGLMRIAAESAAKSGARHILRGTFPVSKVEGQIGLLREMGYVLDEDEVLRQACELSCMLKEGPLKAEYDGFAVVPKREAFFERWGVKPGPALLSLLFTQVAQCTGQSVMSVCPDRRLADLCSEVSWQTRRIPTFEGRVPGAAMVLPFRWGPVSTELKGSFWLRDGTRLGEYFPDVYWGAFLALLHLRPKRVNMRILCASSCYRDLVGIPSVPCWEISQGGNRIALRQGTLFKEGPLQAPECRVPIFLPPL